MTRRASLGGHGLGDPAIPWIVLLDVSLSSTPTTDDLAQRLAAAAREADWPAPGPGAVSVVRSRRDGLAQLCRGSEEPARVAIHPAGVVLGARHDALDGLAMLSLLSRLLDGPVRSTARGVDPTARSLGGFRALLERAWEVGVHPHARVAPSRSDGHGPGEEDALAVCTVDGSPRTADLVRAGAEAVAQWNRSRGVRSTRISAAVGVSTVGGDVQYFADHSGFLRIRHAERLDERALREYLSRAPLQPGGGSSSNRHPRAAAVARVALGLARPRLGSTLLVSHLGTVVAPGKVHDLRFYPVTGGGSGLSLGAVTLRDRTTLTLRARWAHHDDEGLQQLLALVVEALG